MCIYRYPGLTAAPEENGCGARTLEPNGCRKTCCSGGELLQLQLRRPHKHNALLPRTLCGDAGSPIKNLFTGPFASNHFNLTKHPTEARLQRVLTVSENNHAMQLQSASVPTNAHVNVTVATAALPTAILSAWFTRSPNAKRFTRSFHPGIPLRYNTVACVR